MSQWRGILKGTFLIVLMSLATVGLWYGSFYLLLGRPWWRLVGLFLVVAAFRSFILAFDMMWGRPAIWSKDPAERARANAPQDYRHH